MKEKREGINKSLPYLDISRIGRGGGQNKFGALQLPPPPPHLYFGFAPLHLLHLISEYALIAVPNIYFFLFWGAVVKLCCVLGESTDCFGHPGRKDKNNVLCHVFLKI